MSLFSGLRNTSPTKLIMIFLTINFLFLVIQGGLSNYYYQTNRILNEEILNLTNAVHKQSELERFKITLLLNSSIATLVKKIDKTTAATDATTRAIENTTRSLQQQNVYFFRQSNIQDQYRKNVGNNLTAIQQQQDEILANQQALFARLDSLRSNKTQSQIVDNILSHQEAMIKLLLNRSATTPTN